MAARKRTIVIAVLGLIVCLLGGALVLSLLVDPDHYRPQIVSYLESKTGKKIEISRVDVSWLGGSIRLYNFGTRNPEPFPAGYFFRAERIDAAVSLSALLHRQIVVKSVAIQNPTIDVISDPDGLWNFENPGTKPGKNEHIFAIGVIPRVTITGGHLLGSSLIDPSDRPGPVVFEVRNLDLTLTNADFDAFTGSSSMPVGEGDFRADSLRLGSIAVTKVRSRLRMTTKELFFENASMLADRGRASGSLYFNLRGRVPHFESRVRLSDVNLEQLLLSFPAVHGKLTGTMDGEVTLSGPIKHTADPLGGLGAKGKFIVRNGELPSLNSSDNMKQLARFRDAQDANHPLAAFSSLSTDLDLAEQHMSSSDLNIAFYGSDLECSGDLDLKGEGTLHLNGLLKVMKKQGFATNIFARLFREAREQDGRLIFPLQVSGTLAAPQFKLVD